jgi:hypothetical protein
MIFLFFKLKKKINWGNYFGNKLSEEMLILVI